MAFVRGKSTLDTPGVDTNIGKEKREQDESRQHASDVNKGLAESGVSFDSRTQVIDASGYSNARRPYDQYIRENPLAGTIAGQVDVVVNNYSPKVRVNDAGTGLVLSGTKTALESDYAKELRSFLTDALQYQDLRSQNVADAIEKINNDIRQQIERSVVEGGLKTNYDTYKDYAHALEVTTSTNPMKKTGDKNKIFGLLKDGTVDYKTPKDWVEYYKKNYSTADRANLYKNALARYKDFSSGAIDNATEIDLALITPYIVMSGGGRANETNAGMPIYGFNTGERLGAFGESFLNEIGRLIEGGARTVWETVAPALNLGRYKASRVRDISSVFGVDSVDSEQIPWESEENYTNKINSLIGKNVNELTDDEKVFMAASFTLNSMGDWGDTDKSYAENVLDFITDDNGEITEDINRVTGYDSYIHSRDSLSTTEKYTEEVEEKSKQLASGRDWLQERVDAASVYAPISSSLGAMAGTLMRMWAESVIISTATGGLVNPAMISDSIADGIINMLKRVPASSMTATAVLQALQHPVGKFILSIVAELPEDVVQTIIDDVATGRAEDIAQLAPTGDANKDMEKLGESFAQNLAFRLAFTPIHAGAKTFKDWRAARTAAKASGVDKTVPADIFEKNQKLREAADSGSIIDIDANSATVRNPDGTEEVLDNVAMLHFAPDSELAERYPGIAEMIRKKGLVADVADSELGARIESAKRAVSEGEYTAENGVSKVAIAPVNDPYAGYDAPETRLRGVSLVDDNSAYPYVQKGDTERMAMPADTELDTYKHRFSFRPDYTSALGENYDRAKMVGALNLVAPYSDLNAAQDGSFAKALSAVYRDRDDGLIRMAAIYNDTNEIAGFGAFPKDAPEAEAKANIREQLEKIVNERVELLKRIEDERDRVRRTDSGALRQLDESYDGLTNALGQITDEYGVVKDSVVDDIYDYTVNDKGEMRQAIKEIRDSGEAIGEEQQRAILNGVKEKGTRLKQGIVVDGHVSPDGNLLFFSLEPYPNTDFNNSSNKADGNVYHIPKGTKIASTGTGESEYIVDISAGMTGDGTNKYINRPDGSKYTPAAEAFDYQKYIVDEDTRGYERFGQEYLSPVGEKSPEAQLFYHVVGPGGTTGDNRYNVNVTNSLLRSPSQYGQMNPSRPGNVIDAIITGGTVTNGRELFTPLVDFKNYNPTYESIGNSIERWYYRLTGERLSLTDSIYQGMLDDPVGNTVLSNEIKDWAKNDPAGKSFATEIKNVYDWLQQNQTDLDKAWASYLTQDTKDELLNRLLNIQLKYNNSSLDELPVAYQILNNYQYKAPYKAKKSFVVWRGVNDFGNAVNRVSGDAPFGNLKVGDDFTDAGYAYTTLNPYNAREYASLDNNDWNNNRGGYLLRYTVPEGSPVIYFGNPSHFGNRVHAGDGGAIVLPRGVRGKVTAITKTPMGTIIDIDLAGADGNMTGLKTPLETFNENFPGSYRRKGASLESDLDKVYGDDTGAMIVGETARALNKADADVTAADVRKFLKSEEAADINFELNRRLYDSEEITLFRGQPEAELSRKSDVIDITEDGYHFTKDPVRAYDFDGNVVRADINKKYIASEKMASDEWERIDTWTSSLDDLEREAEDLEEGSPYRLFAEGKQNEAVAKSLGKPVIERLDENGETVYTYIPGIDPEFDQAMSTQMLASTERAAIGTGADAANIEMANRIQQALDTEPYGRTIGEIVADKYKKGAATIGDAPDSSSYRWESPDVTKTYNTEAEVFADMPTGKNLTEVRQWEKNAHSFYMDRYMKETVPEFTEKYPTVDEQQQFVRNMDYLFDLQRMDGETIESAVGRTFENEGIVYTVSQDDIDFYQNYVEPQMKGLREAGAAAIGREAFTITGYLPHSDYDPTILTAEDSMQQGVLWREYTGASTTDDDGNFSTGWLNPDLTARYSTFVHNMLWDSLGDNVVVAKYMEEFNADGLNVAANTVEKMVGGRKRLAHLVSESDSVKAVVKNLLGDGELPTEAQLEKAAKDLGSTDIVHDLYRPVYGEAKGLYQTKSATSVKLMSKADWMRSLATGDGTLYDNGGAMIVNGAADAKFLAKRITDAIDNGEELDAHQMFVEYLMQNQRRTAKGAGYIADKWMDKIAQKASNGGISRRALTAELNSLIYGEGANRLFRFIGRMDTSQLTSANKQALDSLLFRHSALSKIKNTSGISAQINKWTNRLISARMKSLFWLNYKNAVLQASECVRLFTEFKFGDARATIKRLATDADFRATVDEWVDMLVPERFVKSDSTAATGALDMVAEKTSLKNGEMTVNKFSADDIRKFGEKIDEFGRAPVELGETMKNRVMMAGILQEAERKGLTGNELFNYVNQRFERVGLAANEMGRLNASDSPLFRLGANLKTFQIRQFRMFLNNIHDMNGAGEAATYIIKNLGWKLGLALIMGKLGYSTAATLGLDPFDLMDDDYTGVDEENYAGLDYAMLSPVAKLFLSGGFTGYINDAYWAARKAYEDNATITEQTENQAGDNIWPGLAMPGMSFDNVFDAFSGFIPGFTAGKRVYQMNELLETGWATSASGNKMYEAPNNPFDIATGYLFGRSNTPNARAYYQNPDYLQGLLENGLPGVAQQFGREFGGFRQFDPIDRQNYSDWFNGTAADEQQWNSGYYYFLNKVNDITDKYQNSLSGYVDDAQREELSLSYNRQIAEIEDQLNRFTTAYETKHPDGIDANKMRNLVNVLNIYEPVLNENEADALERRRKAYNDALYRYTQAGLPAVTSYERGDEGVEAVYSPQVRAALQGRYGLPEEAAQRVKELYNDKWKKLNQQYRDRYYDTKGSKQKKAIQEEYISIVRQDLDPIVSLYGSEIFSNDTVEDIVEDVFNSMIPKYGQTAKTYLKNAYKNYHGTINYAEPGNTTLLEINNLLDQGKTARAKALARTLLQRVQENRTSLTRQEMERLQAILND